MLGERRSRDVAGTVADDGGGAPEVSRGAWRDPVAWAIAAAVFCAYFTISLLRFLTLTPTSWDLGIYTEYVKQLALLRAPVVDVRGPGFNLLGDHFQIGLAVLAPFFRLYPSPATLLFCQALLTAVSVFPVMAAATLLLGRGSGRLIGFAYGFSWGLQQMIDFDFHEIAIAVPLLAFSLSALVRGRVRAAALWALPLVFVKEDQGFTVAAIGAYLIFAGVWTLSGADPPLGSARFREYAIWGTLLVGWGLFWSVFAITVIIPHFNPLHEYYYWKDGGVVAGGHGFSVGSLVVQTASGWPTKLQTVILLLLPTAFAALGSPIALLALPGLLLRFVSTNTAYWGTDWHYNATIMPILFIAAVAAMARWRAADASGPRALLRVGLARHGAPMMAAIAVAVAFQFPLSTLWHGSTYAISPQVAADNAAMAVVPDGVTVQTTLNLLAPLAARTDTFWIGNAGNPLTQYIVFDAKNSGYTPAPANVPAFIAGLYPGAGYTQVFERSDVYVFRRR